MLISPIGVGHSSRFPGDGEWIVSDRCAGLRHSHGGRAHPEKNRCPTSGLDVGSGRSAQLNDRQMLPAFQIADGKSESRATRFSDLCRRRCTSTSSRPAGARLETRLCIGRTQAVVHFSRSSAREGLARSMLVEPHDEERELASHASESDRNENSPGALALHRADEPLDDGDAAVLWSGRSSARASPGTAASRCCCLGLTNHDAGVTGPRNGHRVPFLGS